MGTYRIDARELLDILGKVAKVGVDAAKLADGVQPGELDQLLDDVQAVANAIRRARQD
jgi:hypothetical protein